MGPGDRHQYCTSMTTGGDIGPCDEGPACTSRATIGGRACQGATDHGACPGAGEGDPHRPTGDRCLEEANADKGRRDHDQETSGAFGRGSRLKHPSSWSKTKREHTAPSTQPTPCPTNGLHGSSRQAYAERHGPGLPSIRRVVSSAGSRPSNPRAHVRCWAASPPRPRLARNVGMGGRSGVSAEGSDSECGDEADVTGTAGGIAAAGPAIPEEVSARARVIISTVSLSPTSQRAGCGRSSDRGRQQRGPAVWTATRRRPGGAGAAVQSGLAAAARHPPLPDAPSRLRPRGGVQGSAAADWRARAHVPHVQAVRPADHS